jgi:uncharacterized protein (DUF2126 family)
LGLPEPNSNFTRVSKFLSYATETAPRSQEDVNTIELLVDIDNYTDPHGASLNCESIAAHKGITNLEIDPMADLKSMRRGRRGFIIREGVSLWMIDQRSTIDHQRAVID